MPYPPKTRTYRNGFGSLLKSGQFSDVSLIAPNGKKLKLHKVFLANKSKFFDKMFATDEFSEGISSEVDLREISTATVSTLLLVMFPNRAI